jgi:hypothetical protein
LFRTHFLISCPRVAQKAAPGLLILPREPTRKPRFPGCRRVCPNLRVKVSSCCPHGRGYPDFILLRHDLLLRRSLQVHIIHPGVQQSLRGRAFVVAVGPIACRSMGIH